MDCALNVTPSLFIALLIVGKTTLVRAPYKDRCKKTTVKLREYVVKLKAR